MAEDVIIQGPNEAQIDISINGDLVDTRDPEADKVMGLEGEQLG